MQCSDADTWNQARLGGATTAFVVESEGGGGLMPATQHLSYAVIQVSACADHER